MVQMRELRVLVSMRFTQRFFCFASGVMEGKTVGSGDVDELQKRQGLYVSPLFSQAWAKSRRR